MQYDTFTSFQLEKSILNAIDAMGFVKPTEVQTKVIPKALTGKDLIVLSKTGSGKTASFAIPILNRIMNDKPDGRIRACILTPTRELALQITGDFKRIATGSKVRILSVYGQHSMNEEIKALDKGVDVLCGTPGRVLDHLRNANMSLSDIDYFVLDEADRMLAMGFIEQVEEILEYAPKERTTMLFSATMPIEIMDVCWKYMIDPEEIRLESKTKTVDKIKQLYYSVKPSEKRTSLYKLIALYRPESLIVFCNTRWQVDRITSFLSEKGLSARGIHGGISQAGRTRTMSQFKEGSNDILVATDVAARGIHVEDLEMVINYDVPSEKDNYVHRIGRTGRIGKAGIALTLATSEEMYALYEIEEHIGQMISEASFPPDSKMNEAYQLMKKFYKIKPKSEMKEAHVKGEAKSSKKTKASKKDKGLGVKQIFDKTKSKVKPKTKAEKVSIKPAYAGQTSVKNEAMGENVKEYSFSFSKEGNKAAKPPKADKPFKPAKAPGEDKPARPAKPEYKGSVKQDEPEAKAGSKPKKSLFQRLFGRKKD